MRESRFQRRVLQRLKRQFPDCVVLKGPSNQKQGIPDLVIIHGDAWAMLEVKESATASTRPNQDYYIKKFNEWSFAAFIFPENEDVIFDALQQTFGARG